MNRRLLLLLALPFPLLAQTQQQKTRVYRCGPDGRQLSDRPCDGDLQGQERRHDVPSDADRRAAEARSRDDARQARRLERERLRDEPTARAPGRLDAPRPPEPPASRPADRVAGRVPKKKRPPASP